MNIAIEAAWAHAVRTSARHHPHGRASAPGLERSNRVTSAPLTHTRCYLSAGPRWKRGGPSSASNHSIGEVMAEFGRSSMGAGLIGSGPSLVSGPGLFAAERPSQAGLFVPWRKGWARQFHGPCRYDARQ